MITIDVMRTADWASVRDIYQQGIETGEATFETAAPDWAAWNTAHLVHSRLVARDMERVVGWAALSPVSGRCVYAGVAEVSVYVHQDARRNGIGRALLSALIVDAEHQGIWTLQAALFPENAGSLALHQRCGFRTVGRRERIGQHNGVWRDTLLLERRSPVVG